MKKPALVVLMLFLLIAATVQRANAFDHGHGHWGGNIHRFRSHDLGIWAGGRWFHGAHGARIGWWWIVGDYWYFYPVPVYPYPDPYIPYAVIQQAPAYPPDVTTEAPPPPHARQYWYSCSDPAGYYPYVQNCDTRWKRVPASPEGVTSSASEAPPPPPPPPPSTPPKYWYHCADPEGYYPYVPSCAARWQKVPARTDQPTAPADEQKYPAEIEDPPPLQP